MKYLHILIITIITGCYSKEPIKSELAGQVLPDFTVLLTDSITYYHTSQLPAGKPLVLFYFSTSCPICNAQMDEIIEEMDNLKDLQFLLVTSFPFKDMKNFYTKYKLAKYPNILVGKDTANFALSYFKAPGVPYIAIYGKEKKLTNTFIGKISSDEIKKVAEK